ncbi:hypothetical protein N7582_003132 [Saccharomyces uvarum]|nr:hypothetical protein N7582_003132 [Saccharomyces uvarum]
MMFNAQTLPLYIRTNLRFLFSSLLFSFLPSSPLLASPRFASLRLASHFLTFALSHLLRFESFQGYGTVRCYLACFPLLRCFAKKIFLLSAATTRYAVCRLRSGLCGNGGIVRGSAAGCGCGACVLVAMAIARGLGSSPKGQSVAPDSATGRVNKRHSAVQCNNNNNTKAYGIVEGREQREQKHARTQPIASVFVFLFV